MNHPCQFDGLDCCLNSSLIDDGVCNAENFNQECDFDGFDCSPCDNTTSNWDCCTDMMPCKEGDGDCDSDSQCATGLICGPNNCGQSFPQGFDCCVSNVTKTSSVTEPCPNSAAMGNGICEHENNHATCNYDGGDCCPNQNTITDGECNLVNYNHKCLFDGGDCCYEYNTYSHPHVIGNGKCTFFHNEEMCNFDGGDCCYHPTIGDGICDDNNNNRLCHYDGGDCCFGNKDTARCSFCKCIEVLNVRSCLTKL